MAARSSGNFFYYGVNLADKAEIFVKYDTKITYEQMEWVTCYCQGYL